MVAHAFNPREPTACRLIYIIESISKEKKRNENTCGCCAWTPGARLVVETRDHGLDISLTETVSFRFGERPSKVKVGVGAEKWLSRLKCLQLSQPEDLSLSPRTPWWEERSAL